MKKILIILTLFSAALMQGCKEDIIGQYPIHGNAPSPVSEPVVENLSGSVKITYKLPNVTDLLYVKAIYRNSQDQLAEQKSSIFKNYIELEGFGRSKKQTIQLIAVDRSQNESVAVDVEIEPKDAPIYDVDQTVTHFDTWGGIKFTWSNPAGSIVIFRVFKWGEPNTQYPKAGWREMQSFYAQEQQAAYAIRGLAPDKQKFAYVICDTFGNRTDTVSFEGTPMYEIRIPSNEFLEPVLPSHVTVNQWGKPWYYMFDGVGANDNPGNPQDAMIYYPMMKDVSIVSATNPLWFTFDMTKSYILSRTKVWGRPTQFAYTLHSPRTFEIWGTNDPVVAQNNDSWTGWTKLAECESFKPSGGDVGSAVTGEDKEYAKKGEEFDMFDAIPAVRYVRFKLIRSWSNSYACNISELELYGKLAE